nr:hypothetical protein [Moorena sp. SIO3E8]
MAEFTIVTNIAIVVDASEPDLDLITTPIAIRGSKRSNLDVIHRRGVKGLKAEFSNLAAVIRHHVACYSS